MNNLRPDEFEGNLEAALQELAVSSDTPIIICGMAGSAQGWKEAPYVNLPASTRSLAENAVQVSAGQRIVYIVPGLAQDPNIAPDVMRGEETLLLGLTLTHHIEGTICLPGTHSKWAKLKDGIIKEFHTSMTGEMFALLSKNSTLSHFLEGDISKIDGNSAFGSAVEEALATPQKTLQSLFSVRAMPLLLGRAVETDMSARLSGLLIGLEIAGQDVPRSELITLVSNGDLAHAYRTAFDVVGIRHKTYDAEKLVRAGLFHVALELQEMRAGVLPE